MKGYVRDIGNKKDRVAGCCPVSGDSVYHAEPCGKQELCGLLGTTGRVSADTGDAYSVQGCDVCIQPSGSSGFSHVQRDFAA